MSRTTWFIGRIGPIGLFGLSVAAYAVVLGWSATVLPRRVPTHFGLLGEPDRVSDRGTALVALAALGGGVALLLGGLAAATPRLPMAWVDLPGKERWTRTPAGERRLRELLAEAMWALATWTMLLLLAVLVAVVAAARAPDSSLSGWVWVVLALWLVGLAAGLRRLVLRTRADTPDPTDAA